MNQVQLSAEVFPTNVLQAGLRRKQRQKRYDAFKPTIFYEPLHNPPLDYAHIDHGAEYQVGESKRHWNNSGFHFKRCTRFHGTTNKGPTKPAEFPKFFESPQKIFGRSRQLKPFHRAVLYTRPTTSEQRLNKKVEEEGVLAGPNSYNPYPDAWSASARPVCGIIRPTSSFASPPRSPEHFQSRPQSKLKYLRTPATADSSLQPAWTGSYLFYDGSPTRSLEHSSSFSMSLKRGITIPKAPLGRSNDIVSNLVTKSKFRRARLANGSIALVEANDGDNFELPTGAVWELGWGSFEEFAQKKNPQKLRISAASRVAPPPESLSQETFPISSMSMESAADEDVVIVSGRLKYLNVTTDDTVIPKTGRRLLGSASLPGSSGSPTPVVGYPIWRGAAQYSKTRLDAEFVSNGGGEVIARAGKADPPTLETPPAVGVPKKMDEFGVPTNTRGRPSDAIRDGLTFYGSLKVPVQVADVVPIRVTPVRSTLRTGLPEKVNFESLTQPSRNDHTNSRPKSVASFSRGKKRSPIKVHKNAVSSEDIMLNNLIGSSASILNMLATIPTLARELDAADGEYGEGAHGHMMTGADLENESTEAPG